MGKFSMAATPQQSILVFKYVFFIALLVSLFSGCGNPLEKNQKNASAYWDKATSTLTVSGTLNKAKQFIEIHDAGDGRLLGKAIVKENGDWSASSTTAACTVHIALPDGAIIIDVDNAPGDCTANKQQSAARAITVRDIPVNVKVVNNPTLTNTIPNAVILEPAQDLTINIGDTVNFKGIALGTGVAAPFAYRWNFAGAAPNSAIQNPGKITFNTAGSYFIQLSATDNLGIADPTPATRTITVVNPNSPTSSAPIPMIIAPASINSQVTIGVGDTLFFSGIASTADQAANVNYLFEWDFSGAVPNQFGATPGSITFSQAGTYLVSLYATDENGFRSPTPATMTVTVEANNGINQAPTGTIVEPASDRVINVGDSVTFVGLGTDPDATTPLFYSWDFNGAATNINMSPDPIAGNISFNTPGVFNVTLTVTDALGVADANPPTRVITVQEPVQPPPANGSMATQITSPPSDIKIKPGDSVFFTGEVLGNVNNTPLLYFWSFDGGATDSNFLSPGNITFSLPGKYFVVFYAMDDVGNIVAEPDLVVIKVEDPSKIEAEIKSPSVRSTIYPDEPVLLDGKIEHINGATDITYEWRIKAHGNPDILFTSTLLKPGNFIFPGAGKYHVYLTVRALDISGNPVEHTDEVKINVKPTPPPVSPPGTTPPGSAPPPVTTPPTASPVPVITGPAIVAPIGDMVIPAGDTVAFFASDVNGTNVSYRWDFSGAAAPSNLQTPPPVTFDLLGDYTITLRISGLDSNGTAFDIFAQRLISVIPSVVPPGTTPPLSAGGITTPSTDLVISVGDFVTFKGINLPSASLTYLWDFAGNAPVDTSPTPEPIQFNMQGSYTVTVKIDGVHATGIPINIFDQRVITVLPPTGQAPAPAPGPSPASTLPEGYITNPAQAFITVKVGQAVNFSGAGFDPLGNGPLSFQWSFGGSITNIISQNPGSISFNQIGTHVVTLLVQNALGQYDPTPATVVINVVP
ncbi:MAG TPA: PKD domain-containing protein [Gammaproteobacteria bacterium]|nr:PKD domain-containing protein [Gammaproteobacteria bacterium]